MMVNKNSGGTPVPPSRFPAALKGYEVSWEVFNKHVVQSKYLSWDAERRQASEDTRIDQSSNTAIRMACRGMHQDAEIVLWDPDLFDIAQSSRSGLEGWMPGEEDIPLQPQFWLIDERKGKSEQWELLKEEFLLSIERKPEDVNLIGIMVAGITKTWQEKAKSEMTTGHIEHLLRLSEKGGFKQSAIQSLATIFGREGKNAITAVAIYSMKSNPKECFYRVMDMFVDKPLRGVGPLMVFAGTMFQKQRVVARQRDMSCKKWEDRTREKVPHVPVVKSVLLRRASGGDKAEGLEEAGTRRYSCQWMVGCHWRQQVCGKGRAERKPTLILPYVKGPEDKPLRKRPVVLHARR